MDIGIKVDYGRKARSITAGYKQSREEAGLLIPRKRYGQVYETTTKRKAADKRTTDFLF